MWTQPIWKILTEIKRERDKLEEFSIAGFNIVWEMPGIIKKIFFKKNKKFILPENTHVAAW